MEAERRSRIIALLREKETRIQTEINTLTRKPGLANEIDSKQRELARIQESLHNFVSADASR